MSDLYVTRAELQDPQQLTDHPTSIMKAAADYQIRLRRRAACQPRVGAQASAEVFMQAKIPGGRQFWFLDTRVVVHISFENGQDRISVLEHEAPHGDSPPLHVHRNEDEIFHLLEGEVALSLDGKQLHGKAGDSFLAPKGVPHTYRVLSAGGARWLTITTGEEFERFVRALGRSAERDGLPDRSGPPTPEQVEGLVAAAAQHGIDIVGPPLS
jgi:quercetin dioxygenase-like cupin family protein